MGAFALYSTSSLSNGFACMQRDAVLVTRLLHLNRNGDGGERVLQDFHGVHVESFLYIFGSLDDVQFSHESRNRRRAPPRQR